MNPKLRAFLGFPQKHFLRSLFYSLLRIYVFLMLLAFFFANMLLFHPPKGHDSAIPGQFKLHSADGNEITAIFLPNPKASYVLLYTYGNGEDLVSDMGLLLLFQENGWAVCAFDYPGYGTSTGKPTEAGCEAAIDAAYDYLVTEKKISPEQIVLYGRSLGSGPAVDLASRKPIGGLILESAYTSIFRVITHYRILPWDKFNNIAKMPLIHVPLLSIHGQNDHIVPFWHGEALNAAHDGPTQHLWVPGADHNTIQDTAPADYLDALKKFRLSLPAKAPLAIS